MWSAVAGALLPILRDAGELETHFGRFVLAAGAVGEGCPIIVISLLLTREHSHLAQIGCMSAFVAIAVLAALLTLRVQPPRCIALLARTMHASNQLPVRLCLLAIAALVVLAEHLGLDMILGAFAAGSM